MKHIVIIDDSELVLKIASRALKKLGFAVTTMVEPDSLQPDKGIKPDLMLIDVNMPRFFGSDFVNYFKTEWSIDFPIYLYSDVSEEELSRRAQECGATGYICKGWGLESLVSSVQSILGSAPGVEHTTA